jgi:hypothetical protein
MLAQKCQSNKNKMPQTMLMASKKTKNKTKTHAKPQPNHSDAFRRDQNKTKTHAKNQRIAKRRSKREIKIKRIATNAGTWEGTCIERECTALSGIHESKIAEVERSGLSLSLLREIEAVDSPEIALREVSLVHCEQIIEGSGEVGALGS